MPPLRSQSLLGPSGVQAASQPDSGEIPSWLGPRHCGQSLPEAGCARSSTRAGLSVRRTRKVRFSIIKEQGGLRRALWQERQSIKELRPAGRIGIEEEEDADRKSTRLNSSHL